MSIKNNPLIALIEECIQLRDIAQDVLSNSTGASQLSRLDGLVLLSIAEAGVPLTAAQIGRNLGHSRQVIQRIGNELLDLGLLQRIPNPDHKTAPLLQLTPKGRKLEKDMGDGVLKLVRTLFTEADLKRCRRLAKDVRKMRLMIETYEPRQSGNKARQRPAADRGS